ncbi:hypothetical protein C8Q76DRAFT_602407, partial [Earliella scabrosa]
RFPRELEREVLRHCDMVTLLYCQEICSRFRVYIGDVLRADRDRILATHVPDPQRLLDVIHEESAVVTGDAALALVLRDHSILSIYLDIAVGRGSEGALEKYLHEHLDARCIWHSPGRLADHAGEFGTYLKLYHIKKGHLVRLIYSPTASAGEVLAWFPNTGVMNYFNRTTVGCAYPLLTLRRLAMSYSWRALDAIDRCDTARLLVRGFRFSQIPGPLMGLTTSTFPVAGSSKPRYDCYRSLFVCPEQDRFLGDAGSMVLFF